MKPCSKCGDVKDLSEFHIDRGKRDGRGYICKVCMVEKNASRPSGYNRASEAKRRAAKRGATPMLTSQQMQDVADIYSCARQLRELGFDVQVDHIDPLMGRRVCGLHVPENLTILPTIENAAKGNRFTPYRVCDNIITPV